MKFEAQPTLEVYQLSPPSRGAWIEMILRVHLPRYLLRRPPRGGRGLKYDQVDYRTGHDRRPPRGGRGLKYLGDICKINGAESPPSRGAWIEIGQNLPVSGCAIVAPLAGGVD